MKKKYLLLILGILLISIFIYFVSAIWWNNTFLYNKPITITETSGTTLSNYSILMNISYDSHMNADFSDLRFIGSDNTTELGYWIKNYTSSTNAWVYVKVPTLTASSNTTIYMYYGNSGASTTSNENNVMYMSDDFSTTEILSKLNNYYYYSTSTGIATSSSPGKGISGGVLTISQTPAYTYARGVYSPDLLDKIPINESFYISTEYKDSPLEYNGGIGIRIPSESSIASAISRSGVDLVSDDYSGVSQSSGFHNINNDSIQYSTTYGEPNIMEFMRTSDNIYTFKVNGTIIYKGTITGLNNKIISVGFATWTTSGQNTPSSASFNNISVSSYSTQNPTYFIGSEQNSSILTTINSPINTYNSTSSNILFNWTLTPINVNLTNTTLYNWYSNGTLLSSTFYSLSGNQSITTTQINSIVDGSYIWNAQTCGDSGSGCSFATNRTFSIDTPPQITINSPTATMNTNNVTFNYTFTNPVGTLDYCSYNVTNTSLNVIIADNPINCSNPVEYQTISDGQYILNVFANETNGNTNTTSFNFNVSTTPDIHFQNQTLVNNSNISTSYIPINVSLQETFFKNVTFNFYNTNGTLISYSYTDGTRFINKSFPDGNYNYNVTVWTTTDQTNSTNTRKVLVDTTFPSVSITNPYGTYSIIDQIPYSINVTDTNLDSCYYNVTYGASTEIVDTTLNISTNPITGILAVSQIGTTYVFHVACTDLSGNVNTSNQTFYTTATAVISTGGGSGGSIPIVIKQKATEWLMKTQEGATAFALKMIPGISKQNDIKFTNTGTSAVQVQLTCTNVKGNMCQYLTYESSNVSITLTGDTPIYDTMTISLPQDISLGKYISAITATDGDNNIQVISVSVDVSSGFLSQIAAKLTNNFDGTPIPMIVIFLFVFIFLGYILGYTLFKNTSGGKAWGFGASLFITLILVGLS
ncbi:MAG: DUF2341 domain-containing protein [Chlorobi bacterium]|nr:DUF2341 domain-containing protein [Chlorobiota bacterium]